MRPTSMWCVVACVLFAVQTAGHAAAAQQQPAASAPAATSAASSVRPAAGPAPSRLEDYKLLAVSPSEHVVVLRGSDGRLVTVREGMPLPVEHAVLKEVTPGKVRFDVVGAAGQHVAAWMAKATGPDATSTVERVSTKAPVEQAVPQRQIKTAPADSASSPQRKR